MSWILISSAIILMGVRRCITLFRLLTGDMKHPPDHTAELVALFISVLMFAGIARIHTYFQEIKKLAEERRQAEKRSTRLGRILDNSSNEIYLFDAETLRFVQVNLGARENLGFSADELSNLTPLDLKPEFTAEVFDEILKPLRLKQKPMVQFPLCQYK
ncbi:hypothetical protein UZ36_06940 [Candidatus Nitromaritima sp. SCGC AAA799-C22]|nr:hypothetical protein UZ36_06940 [Candidatus Nitromaritima sp. SCGC AAA799-C22]